MRYKIGYLTSKNPMDIKESSGVYYYQAKALEKYCGEVHYLGPVRHFSIFLLEKLFNIFNRFSTKKYNYWHSKLISKIYGIIFSRKLKNKKFDFIIAEKASCEIAFLKTKLPLIYSTDATFNLLLNYYPNYSNLLKISEKEGNYIEERAIHKSSLVICTSKWASSSVINDYGYPGNHVNVLPRGANINQVIEKNEIFKKKKSETCRLLFIGREYYRKGLDVAFRTMDYIRSNVISVKLVVVGCIPPPEFVDLDVEVISFIDKNTDKGKKEFKEIMLHSDFMLIPTRAEAMGISFCEASAFGLPVITRDTGGVTEVVKNGVNGFALKYDSNHIDFGETIIKIFNSDDDYYRLIQSSREYYDKNLSWDKWGEKMKNILDNIH